MCGGAPWPAGAASGVNLVLNPHRPKTLTSEGQEQSHAGSSQTFRIEEAITGVDDMPAAALADGDAGPDAS